MGRDALTIKEAAAISFIETDDKKLNIYRKYGTDFLKELAEIEYERRSKLKLDKSTKT